MSQPGFWSANHEPITKELRQLHAIVDPFLTLKADLASDLELAALAAGDAELTRELGSHAERYQAQISKLQEQCWFSGPHDRQDAILTIHSGAGGADSMEWASWVERMYWRFLSCSFEVSIEDRQEGKEVGIRKSVIRVSGQNAFGTLRSEIGVHRICHISRFDSSGKKQTSFASVGVEPIYPETAVEIREQDLRVDTYCAGGPGGQNVNKVASAVRMTHLPTNTVVQCQSQRSQDQNRRRALEQLAAKLKAQEELALKGSAQESWDAKSDVAFGHQIRTYTLEPAHRVKDHRTDHETSDASGVLDGDLGGFVRAYLSQQK